MAVEVRRVNPTDTLALRRRVLRPHQTIAELARESEGAPDLACYAAFDDGTVVGTGTVHREAPPWRAGDRQAWRVRGMATAQDRQRAGIGGDVLAALVDHVRAHGGGLLWCNARTAAVAFYARAGFATHGEPFDEPVIGPHLAMWRRVDVDV